MTFLYRNKIVLGLTVALLLTVPVWTNAVGGYTDLASRVLIYVKMAY